MSCVGKGCAYALFGIFVCFSSFTATGRDNVSPANNDNSKDKFQWMDHTKLSWDDFKGEVNATHDESAAATCCSIGFKTNTPSPGGKQEIIVYNTFYVNKSWVRTDARIASILDHEQGHFDLCEIYTRKLRDRMQDIDPSAPGMKPVLMQIYTEVSKEYEARQQAYEDETIHGTDFAMQKKWQQIIASELVRQVNAQS